MKYQSTGFSDNRCVSLCLFDQNSRPVYIITIKFFMLLVGICSVIGVFGRSQNPRVSVTAIVVNEQVVFDIKHSGGNGILSLKVIGEDGSLLWSVDLNYFRGNQIKYGILPATGVRQSFPPNDGHLVNIIGKTVNVEVDIQYDHLAPSVRTFVMKVVVPA